MVGIKYSINLLFSPLHLMLLLNILVVPFFNLKISNVLLYKLYYQIKCDYNEDLFKIKE